MTDIPTMLMHNRTGPSEAEIFAALPASARAAAIAHWPAGKAAHIEYDWSFWQRPDQAVPSGDWRTWLVMAGRGFGKTRTGAEWVRAIGEAVPSARIALIGATMADVRSVMIEGPSGLLAIALPEFRPRFEPSLRQLTWPGGAVAHIYSAAEPETLRGGQHEFAWADEIAKWDQGIATWDNMSMALRGGVRPQIMATTTPRAVPLLTRLIAQDGTIVTRGRTAHNRSNLAASFLHDMKRQYGSSRLARQELDGELLTDVEGALWSRDLLDRCRISSVPVMARVVIGVDPPASAGGDACGIIVAGLGQDGRAYVLADASVRGLSPEGWARAVSAAAAAWDADRVIAEANQGGDMVRAVLTAADTGLPVTLVHASRGKIARAEPVAVHYEAGRVAHAGSFAQLEDELCGLMIGGGYAGPGRSPDRADACVWALSALLRGAGDVVARVRVV